MSATDVIEQIKKLPPEERAKVAEFVRGEETFGAKTNVDEEFKRIAGRVFTTNAELFRKLAQ
jgi:hypothetical protein